MGPLEDGALLPLEELLELPWSVSGGGGTWLLELLLLSEVDSLLEVSEVDSLLELSELSEVESLPEDELGLMMIGRGCSLKSPSSLFWFSKKLLLLLLLESPVSTEPLLDSDEDSEEDDSELLSLLVEPGSLSTSRTT